MMIPNPLNEILTKAGASVIVIVPNLENGTIDPANTTYASEGVCEDVSKRLKERVQVGVNENGAPIYKWADGQTTQELQANVARILMDAGVVQNGSQNKKDVKPTVTVAEFIKQTYWPTFVGHLAPTTRENYRQYIELNIIPFMGSIPMNEVSVATIQQFYDWMATAHERGRKKDLNAKTIERVSGLAGRIFKVAFEMGIIQTSPFKKTLLTIRAEEAGHHEALPDEVMSRAKQMVPMLTSRDERLYMGLLMYTGMRPEEVRGLMWEDIDLDEQFGTVVRAVTYPDNNKPHVGRPKTKRSGRTVLLPMPLVDILLTEKRPNGFICGGDAPWCYSKATRVSTKAFKHLQLDGYTDYDLRSTFGTQLKELGVSSATVADVMGHADTRMVETVYARTRHEGVMKLLSAVEQLAYTPASRQ